MSESVIGVYSNNNLTANIYPSTIKNPYCVYLPRVEKNKLKEFVHIDETIITKYVYDIFIKTMYLGDPKDSDEKVDSFIKWINKFQGINKSNWYVIINKMYKKNILN
tara:strand:- start:794 stop:1114 length:321 start_codon:yes stop_codon:yes gene_type:complete